MLLSSNERKRILTSRLICAVHGGINMFNTVNKDFHKQRVTQQMIRSVKRSHFNCITFHRDGLCPLPFQSSTLIHSNPTWLIWQKHFYVEWIMILKRHVDLVTMALWIFGRCYNILHWYALFDMIPANGNDTHVLIFKIHLHRISLARLLLDVHSICLKAMTISCQETLPRPWKQAPM